MGIHQLLVAQPPAQLGHKECGLKDDATRHLGCPNGAVPEGDGYLDNRESSMYRAIGHFHLEDVASRANLAEGNRLKHLSSKALETPSQIARGNAEDSLCVEAAPPADRAPDKPSVLYGPARDVP